MRKMTKHQIIASVETGPTVETAIPEALNNLTPKEYRLMAETPEL